MTTVTRIRLLTAVLGVAAASTAVLTTVFGDTRGKGAASAPALAVASRSDSERLADEFARTKFATQPTLVFKGAEGPAVFAWQVKPSALPGEIRDRDILVMVDTSASQAGEPLKRARQIVSSLSSTARANDRIDLWTVNLDHADGTRSLTRGFKAAKDDGVQAATSSLVETEFASGATDLKAGLKKALAAFERNPARQQIILFLGDGESAASKTPLDEQARLELGGQLDQAEIAFFAVPVGMKVNALNLHGFATLTGGTVVRLTEDVTTERGRTQFGDKLKAAFDVPVLKPVKVTYSGTVGDVFPSRLPPLRTDRATLVLGTLAGDSLSLAAKIEGTVNGRPASVEVVDRLASPDAENYFVHAMIEQWKTAAVKDAPAMLASDRALALASQQFRLFREEYLTQAVFAITSDKIDHAEKLYAATLKIDPTNSEAARGMAVLGKVRRGEVPASRIKGGETRAKIKAIADEPPAAAGGAKPAPAPGVAASDPLKQALAEKAVQEQKFRVLVDETIRAAKGKLVNDPDTAYEELKRQRDAVLAVSELSDPFRQKLAADLEAAMQTISTKGAEIKRRAAEERERVARTTLRISEFERQRAAEETTRSQIEAFRQLMSQARFELAQQEAQVMIQDRVSRGQPVPPEAVASYLIGQAATNYREYRELVRIREDRYLLTMMQTEKSFIPYPDEPPVHFPPAAVWRELTSQRSQTAAGTLGGNMTPSQRRNMQRILDTERIRIEQTLDGKSLEDFLKDIESNHNLKFVILEEEFKAAGEQNVREKKLNLKQSLFGLTVGSALDIALQNIQLTYIVRPEYIEICTYDKRLSEKVVQTFDLGQLVYDIPSSVNQAVLNQNQNVQNTNLQLFGQATFAGGFGGVGGIGLGGGGFGGGGFGGGGFGGGGGGQPQFAAQGAGVLGAGGNAQNLGQGGGVAGVGGGQLGQFGNLGGQFGIQGNALQNYQLIAKLVMEVVARGEWADLGSNFNVTAIPGQNNNIPDDPIPKVIPEAQLNSLAYYPPARAMIVRATGKYHPQSSIKLKKSDGSVQGGPGDPNRNAVANAAPAPAVDGNRPDRVALPKDDLAAAFKAIDRRQPGRMWQQAADVEKITDPGIIVAAADFLMEFHEFNHAAEVIKAGIRTGLTTDAWAQDALSIALRGAPGGGATFDAERAALSAIDLEPENAKSYIKAAKASDEAGRHEIAVAYCQRAANIDGNMPVAYANALVYAEKSENVNASEIAWASGNLLNRDWIDDGTDYHAETRARLNKIVTTFEGKGLGEQVKTFRKVLENEAQRDLVIELLWQGEADLDLYVVEPSGSVAGPTNKRTTGGGVLRGDVLEQGNDRSEIYTASQAFSGKYIIKAKQAFKTAVGSKAQVKVTKFKGTSNESVEFHTLNLASNESVEVTVASGSRNELVMLSDPEPAELTFSQTATERSTVSGGTAGAGVRSGSSATNLPTVVKPFETRLTGIAPSAPSMRAEATVTPDRKQVRITANAVFGTSTDVPMPKVTLLPGGGK